jgi:hypothetical protein
MRKIFSTKQDKQEEGAAIWVTWAEIVERRKSFQSLKHEAINNIDKGLFRCDVLSDGRLVEIDFGIPLGDSRHCDYDAILGLLVMIRRTSGDGGELSADHLFVDICDGPVPMSEVKSIFHLVSNFLLICSASSRARPVK